MGILVFLVILAVSGLIIGALSRLALPGPDPMGIPATIVLGLGGSFLGGAGSPSGMVMPTSGPPADAGTTSPSSGSAVGGRDGRV